MKRMILIFIVITIALTLIVFYLKNDIEAEKKEIFETSKSTFETYLIHNPVDVELFTDDNMERPDTISKEQAIDDMEYFFSILRNQYAAYELFGGSKTFESIKIKVNNLLVSDRIYVDQFSKIIHENLQVINDAHFNFDGQTLTKRKCLYTTSEYIFTKEGEYFTFVSDEKTYFLREAFINEEPMDLVSVLYPVLDADGQEKYQFGIIKPIDGAITFVDFTYALTPEGEVYEKNRELLFYYNVKVPIELPIYSEEMINGIKVIQINSFIPKNDEEEALLGKFATSFEGLSKNTPVVIDLRFNSGGNSVYADTWALNTFGASTILGNYFTAYLTDEGWSDSSFISQVKIKNDIPIYVLTSIITASSAEGLSKFLSNIDNVTFIGENTMGCQLVGNIKPWILPHSKIKVSFGSALFMEKDLKLIEGVGFFPDLWTDPMLALDRAIAYISRKHM